MTFQEYMMDWWSDFTCANDSKALTLMSDILDCSLDEAKEELADGQSPEEWVAEYEDVDTLYEVFFGNGVKTADWGLDPEAFLAEMFKDACPGEQRYEDEFTDDMALQAQGYRHIRRFFYDLARGGCHSGMIGTLINHTNCDALYGRYEKDMENKKSELEKFVGPIREPKGVAHSDFMCWLCYEELAREIATELFTQKY